MRWIRKVTPWAKFLSEPQIENVIHWKCSLTKKSTGQRYVVILPRLALTITLFRNELCRDPLLPTEEYLNFHDDVQVSRPNLHSVDCSTVSGLVEIVVFRTSFLWKPQPICIYSSKSWTDWRIKIHSQNWWWDSMQNGVLTLRIASSSTVVSRCSSLSESMILFSFSEPPSCSYRFVTVYSS